MKKFVTLVLILSLGLFTVVGCGQAKKKGSGKAEMPPPVQKVEGDKAAEGEKAPEGDKAPEGAKAPEGEKAPEAK
jgi:hypothetical protein